MGRFLKNFCAILLILGFAWISYSQSMTGESYQGAGLGVDGFNPTQLGNLFAWFKAGEGITLTSGKVSAWDDQTTNAFQIIQTTGGNRPLHITNSINGLHSIKVGDYAGSSSLYATNTSDRLRQLIAGDKVPYSVVIVGKALDSNNNAAALSWGNNTNGVDGFKYRLAGGGPTFPFTVSDTTAASTTEADNMLGQTATNVFNFYYYSYNGNTNGIQGLYTNGMNGVMLTNQIHGASSTLHSTDTFAIGGFYRSGGSQAISFVNTEIAEVLIYNRPLTTNEFFQINYGYLRPKYGLQ